jgi:hypothetical protein
MTATNAGLARREAIMLRRNLPAGTASNGSLVKAPVRRTRRKSAFVERRNRTNIVVGERVVKRACHYAFLRLTAAPPPVSNSTAAASRISRAFLASNAFETRPSLSKRAIGSLLMPILAASLSRDQPKSLRAASS